MNVLRSLVGSKKKDEKADDPAVAQPSNEDHSDEKYDNQEDRKKLWTKVSGLIGKDTTSLLSLPVSMFEPVSVLQSMCEPLRYHSIIEQVCNAEDPVDRICQVAAFCVAFFEGYNRTVKPFNPTLGETYEFEPQNKSYKCLCEQVSHHPPIGIAYTTSENWTLQQESRIETKFWGNTVDVYSVGSNDLKIFSKGEHYMWTNPLTTIHNIIFGHIWVEHVGAFPVKNLTTGDTCTIHYKKAGWFEGLHTEISGEARDKDGNLKAIITGKYDDAIYVTKVDINGNKSDPIELWRKPREEIVNKWKWPAFLFELSDSNEEYEQILPRSDSRLRGDVRALAQLNMRLAGREKTKIEEAERQKRRDREARSQKWTPVYFEKKPGEGDKEGCWQYTGNYWEEKDQRITQYKAKRAAEESKDKTDPINIQEHEQRKEEQQSPRSP